MEAAAAERGKQDGGLFVSTAPSAGTRPALGLSLPLFTHAFSLSTIAFTPLFSGYIHPSTG